MLLLRALYFMLAAFLSYFDSVNSLLAIILITIGSKIFLAAADIEAPSIPLPQSLPFPHPFEPLRTPIPTPAHPSPPKPTSIPPNPHPPGAHLALPRPPHTLARDDGVRRAAGRVRHRQGAL